MRKERRRGVGCKMLSLLAGWLLLWAVDSGLSAAVLRGFGPKLTADVVRQFGEESLVYGTDLKGRLRILQQKIDGVVGGGLSNCGSEDSVWELKQVHLALNTFTRSKIRIIHENIIKLIKFEV